MKKQAKEHMGAPGGRRVPAPLAVYDVTALVGLKTRVYNAAVETKIDDEEAVHVPRLNELLAAAAVKRALMPIRLRGHEIKAIRKIMGLTLGELANKLDEKTASETLSRWESEAQPMGGYVEKLLRLVVCEALSANAPGVGYKAGQIAELRLLDPWRIDPNFEIPYMDFEPIKLKAITGDIGEVWDTKIAA